MNVFIPPLPNINMNLDECTKKLVISDEHLITYVNLFVGRNPILAYRLGDINNILTYIMECTSNSNAITLYLDLHRIKHIKEYINKGNETGFGPYWPSNTKSSPLQNILAKEPLYFLIDNRVIHKPLSDLLSRISSINRSTSDTTVNFSKEYEPSQLVREIAAYVLTSPYCYKTVISGYQDFRKLVSGAGKRMMLGSFLNYTDGVITCFESELEILKGTIPKKNRIIVSTEGVDLDKALQDNYFEFSKENKFPYLNQLQSHTMPSGLLREFPETIGKLKIDARPGMTFSILREEFGITKEVREEYYPTNKMPDILALPDQILKLRYKYFKDLKDYYSNEDRYRFDSLCYPCWEKVLVKEEGVVKEVERERSISSTFYIDRLGTKKIYYKRNWLVPENKYTSIRVGRSGTKKDLEEAMISEWKSLTKRLLNTAEENLEVLKDYAC